MSARISIAGVSERDIDLLLLEEFQSSRAFRQWFAAQVLGKARRLGELISAQRSVTHSAGEIDLEIVLSDESGREVRILIENKVNAGFQPQQAERYRKRGESYVSRKAGAEYHTVIIAPSRYFGDTASTKGFDKRITYEAVLDWFTHAHELGARRAYKTTLLKSAIEKGTLGYQPEEDKPVTNFWRAYWRFARDHAPELEMKEPKQKPSRAGFIHFFPRSLPRGIEIHHKFKKGRVDMQVKGFGNRLNELHRSLHRHLRRNMTLKQAGKSGAIRVEVPALDPNRPFEEQLPQAQIGLRAAMDLLHWFREHQRLMPNHVYQPTPASGRG